MRVAVITWGMGVPSSHPGLSTNTPALFERMEQRTLAVWLLLQGEGEATDDGGGCMLYFVYDIRVRRHGTTPLTVKPLLESGEKRVIEYGDGIASSGAVWQEIIKHKSCPLITTRLGLVPVRVNHRLV